jgi:hypothetical protein
VVVNAFKCPRSERHCHERSCMDEACAGNVLVLDAEGESARVTLSHHKNGGAAIELVLSAAEGTPAELLEVMHTWWRFGSLQARRAFKVPHDAPNWLLRNHIGGLHWGKGFPECGGSGARGLGLGLEVWLGERVRVRGSCMPRRAAGWWVG